MIDTIKIYCEIPFKIYSKIYNKSIVKSSINKATGELIYEVVNDHLEGSYSSSLSMRVGNGAKYQFSDLFYYIEIEGSYHKIIKGYNSHNGFYDLEFICKELIEMAENAYEINLPILQNWYLQRCDIAICYDLGNQKNVKDYINSLSRCSYPRRKLKFFYDESVYISGTMTTLKIYNKYLEFRKNDLKKFHSTNFDIMRYLEEIQGFVRFECEVKKKMLVKLYNKKHIRIIDIKYEDLRKIWSDEFMKMLNLIEKDLEIVRGMENVKERLLDVYKKGKAMRLYNFYCAVQLEGLQNVKRSFLHSTYYQNIKDLKQARVDFSQMYKIEETFYFNPFESQEVA